jgi:XisH protein
MPAPDIYHHVVKNALIKDGWTITHDPYALTFGQRNVFVDLGVEHLVAAERNHESRALGLSTCSERLSLWRSIEKLPVTPYL